jgi:uncharacterized SAM-binding protein YcdF (DUF218 family)
MIAFLTSMTSPLSLLWFGILLSILFYVLKKKFVSKVFASCSLLWLALVSTTFSTDLLIKSLESQYSTISFRELSENSDSVNILVLGGGFSYDKELPVNQQLSEASLSRLIEGIKINLNFHKSSLIFSGDTNGDTISQAEVFVQTALMLNIDSLWYKSTNKATKYITRSIRIQKIV